MDQKAIEADVKNYKIREGPLYKRSKFLKEWRERWIVLTSNYLYTFTSKSLDEVTDVIDLKQIKSYKSYLRKDQEMIPPGFKLRTGDDMYYFCAKNCNQKWTWLVSLERLMDYKYVGTSNYNNADWIKTKGFESQAQFQGKKSNATDIPEQIKQVKGKTSEQAKSKVNDQADSILKQLQQQQKQLQKMKLQLEKKQSNIAIQQKKIQEERIKLSQQQQKQQKHGQQQFIMGQGQNQNQNNQGQNQNQNQNQAQTQGQNQGHNQTQGQNQGQAENKKQESCNKTGQTAKKTEETKNVQTKKPEQTKKAQQHKKVQETKKAQETKKVQDTKKVEDPKKVEQQKKTQETKKAQTKKQESKKSQQSKQEASPDKSKTQAQQSPSKTDKSGQLSVSQIRSMFQNRKTQMPQGSKPLPSTQHKVQQKKQNKLEDMHACRSKVVTSLFEQFRNQAVFTNILKYVTDFLVNVCADQKCGYSALVIIQGKTNQNRKNFAQVFIELLTLFNDYERCENLMKFIQICIFQMPGLFTPEQSKKTQNKLKQFFDNVNNQQKLALILKNMFIMHKMKKYAKNDIYARLDKIVKQSKNQETRNWAMKLKDDL